MSDSIDTVELSNLKEVMEDEFEMLVSMYLDDTKKMIEQMDSAIQKNDIESLKIVSHTLKGSSSNMFVVGMSQLSKDMEDKARASELSSAQQLIPQLREEYEKVKGLLEAF